MALVVDVYFVYCQMVDVGTSMTCIAGSPDSGLPSSTPVTPVMNNAFTFPNQNSMSNAVTRQRSMSLPGYAETPQDRVYISHVTNNHL